MRYHTTNIPRLTARDAATASRAELIAARNHGNRAEYRIAQAELDRRERAAEAARRAAEREAAEAAEAAAAFDATAVLGEDGRYDPWKAAGLDEPA